MVTAATDSSGVGVDSTQVSIANYLDSLTGPITSGCKYELYEDDDADNDGYQFNVFYVNCPILPNRAVYVTFTDSVQGWENTVEHCANVLYEVTENKNSAGVTLTITKKYAVWGLARNPTVSFYRFKSDDTFVAPTPQSIGLFEP